MKRFFTTALALTMAFLMTFLCTAQVFAESETTYVSEVKVAMGGSAIDDLKNDGFKILCDEDGEPVDLNVGAGGGRGSQGNKRVLMGYKTTTKVEEAITDLAVMNMEGGYDVNEYDLLMKRYMGAQISLRGSSASRESICDALFEGAESVDKWAQTFKIIVHSLRNTLEKYGFENLLIHSRNRYSIEPGLLNCDYFDFVTGKPAVPPATGYQGEFMAQYSWAERFVYMLEMIKEEGAEQNEE